MRVTMSTLQVMTERLSYDYKTRHPEWKAWKLPSGKEYNDGMPFKVYATCGHKALDFIPSGTTAADRRCTGTATDLYQYLSGALDCLDYIS